MGFFPGPDGRLESGFELLSAVAGWVFRPGPAALTTKPAAGQKQGAAKSAGSQAKGEKKEEEPQPSHRQTLPRRRRSLRWRSSRTRTRKRS